MRPELWMPIAVGAAMLLSIIIVWILFYRFKRKFVYQVISHAVSIEISSLGVFLYVDDALEDQVMARGLRLATLRADIGGEVFKAHISFRGFRRVEVSATYAGREVLPIRVGK